MNFINSVFLVSAQFVKKANGKDLALLNGYSFYCHKIYARSSIWRCTNVRCSARLIVAKDFTVTRASVDHAHKAPTFVMRDGVYIKV